MHAVKRLALLGSTGSIGRQTLDVVDAFPERFQVVALACRASAAEVVAQAQRYHPSLVGVVEPEAAREVAEALAGSGIRVAAGPEAVVECALIAEADIVMAAATGVAGLPAVWEAVRAGRTVALANKEPLVVAGHLITAEAARTGATLLPVDSEHSAIFQALLGQDRQGVRRVVLTASGGAFRELSTDQLEHVTPEQALAHPSWKMGKKVTIDSATLMNKGLEVIEAHRLYGIPYERIEVVIHPQSIVHSMVEFADGAIKAQLSPPDMRLPIQYALSYPDRWDNPDLPRAYWPKIGRLDFSAPDYERFPCLRIAIEAGKKGNTYPAVLSAADEDAVNLFLDRRIRFGDIARLVQKTLEEHIPAGPTSLESIAAAEAWARQRVLELARSL